MGFPVRFTVFMLLFFYRFHGFSLSLFLYQCVNFLLFYATIPHEDFVYFVLSTCCCLLFVSFLIVGLSVSFLSLARFVC